MRIDNNATDVIMHQQYNPTTLKQGNWQTIYYKEKGQLKIYWARGETNLVVDYFTKHHPRFPSSISQNCMHKNKNTPEQVCIKFCKGVLNCWIA